LRKKIIKLTKFVVKASSPNSLRFWISIIIIWVISPSLFDGATQLSKCIKVCLRRVGMILFP
jgi:hypothetical protein